MHYVKQKTVPKIKCLRTLWNPFLAKFKATLNDLGQKKTRIRCCKTFRLLGSTTLCKTPYSELFWSVFSRIRAEYGEIRSISPYSVQTQENVDQNNSSCSTSQNINLIHPSGLFLYPLKTSEHSWFSDFFRGV